jgi:hypothetical protein
VVKFVQTSYPCEILLKEWGLNIGDDTGEKEESREEKEDNTEEKDDPREMDVTSPIYRTCCLDNCIGERYGSRAIIVEAFPDGRAGSGCFASYMAN